MKRHKLKERNYDRNAEHPRIFLRAWDRRRHRATNFANHALATGFV